MPRAKQRTPELRERLLRVAVATLASEGPTGLTTRRIAKNARTSPPAVYELFGDKAGLMREMFFAGFDMLRRHFDRVKLSRDPIADLMRVIAGFRLFMQENPMLAQLMFMRPFADFDPGPAELAAGKAVRLFIIAQVQRCIAAGRLAGDATDIAHVLVSTAHGLAATELAGWLGTSRASCSRRWQLAIQAVLRGLHPSGGTKLA